MIHESDIPTTEHVRAQFARQENYDRYYEGDLYLTPNGQVSAKEFDAWYEAERKKWQAEALESAADAADECAEGGTGGGEWFPSEWAGQVAGWLSHRAEIGGDDGAK